MSKGDKESYTTLLKAQAHIWNQLLAFINSAALKCAVQLGIPDIIHRHGEIITLNELLSALPVHPCKAPYILRIMSLLVHSGFFTQGEKGFSLTPSSRLLLKDVPFSERAMVMMFVNPVFTRHFDNMFDWLQNDDSTLFAMACKGLEFWDHVNFEEPNLGAMFNEAMADDSKLIECILLNERYKGVFEGLDSLVDVGGGMGTMAKALAREFASLKCIVLDLPQVVAKCEGSGNLEFVEGDMFDWIPPANAIFLKWILHNWSDEKCVKILEKCKEAIPKKEEGGKVIIMDMILKNQTCDDDDDESVETQLLFDMLMMANFGGRERSEKEWEKLFSNAGFSSYKIITPALGLRHLIEVYP